MDAFRIDSDVFVTTGYTDSQLIPQGFVGKVIAKQGVYYLVRDGRGEVTCCDPYELQPVTDSLKEQLPASANPRPPIS